MANDTSLTVVGNLTADPDLRYTPAGVAMASEHKPDLILMDIQLPVLDGYETTRRIKADPALKHIPIIAVTSYALSGDEAKTREAGCDGYVAKPFSPRQLLAIINDFLAP